MADFPRSYYKQLIEVVLVVGSVNLNGGGISKYLVVNQELPHQLLSPTETTLDLAATLLLNDTGWTAKINTVGWIPLHLGGVFDTVDRIKDGVRTLAISYGAIIPAVINPTLPAEWLSFQDIFEKKILLNDYLQILSTTSLRI
jgi:hypothetical protein